MARRKRAKNQTAASYKSRIVPSDFTPTEEQIAVLTAEIRAEWDAETLQRRCCWNPRPPKIEHKTFILKRKPINAGVMQEAVAHAAEELEGMELNNERD